MRGTAKPSLVSARLVSILRWLLYVALLTVGVAAYAAPTPNPPAPSIPARAHILQEFHSGRILASSNIDERLEPASLTKIMTVYTAAHALDQLRMQPAQKVFR